MQKPNPGDRVDVTTKDGVVTGVVMPRPRLVPGDDLVLKLDSGYNLGLSLDDIESITVISKKKRYNPRNKRAASNQKSNKKITILSTGGTIASRIDYRSGGVSASFTAEDLFESVPEIQDYATITAKSIMNVMSEDMNPSMWLEMAKAAHRELKRGADGVVIAHGTDTMHYSSAALSFLLPNCPAPVIFTGSQRSTDRGSSDASLNLLCSVIAATGDIAGVHIVMHGSMDDNYCLMHNGTRVRKMHTTRRDAFKSINADPIAKIHPNGAIEHISQEYRKRGEGVLKLDGKTESNVGFIKVYPGMPPQLVDFYVERGAKGIVLEGTALGHVPTAIEQTSLIPPIESAISKGVVVCMTTQCLFGRVHPLVYSNLRELSLRGVIFCEDMLAETAYVKLMWVLGHTTDPKKAADMMLTNHIGEISDKSTPKTDFIP